MLAIHPETSSLQRFMRGEATGSENRDVVAHLLTGCRDCRAVASEEWSRTTLASVRERNGEQPMDWSSRKDAVLSQRLGAGALWSRLEPLPHSRRRVVVRNSRRYQTLGLCQLLIDMAFEHGFDEPAAALPLAELAVDVADHLDPEILGEGLVNDFRARALGYRANALRINAEYRTAESLLLHAHDLLEMGSGDVLEEALLLRFQAYLEGDRGNLAEARRFLRRSIRLYRRVGDRKLANRISITLAAYLGQDGRPEEAVRVLRRTLEVLDSEDTRVILGCRHNLAANLKNCGRVEEALAVLQESRELYSAVGDRVILMKLKTMEGELAQRIGNPTLAEHALRGACRGYEELDLPFKAAFVGLRLADLYLEQGRMREVLELSARLHHIFTALDTTREALAAVQLFREAAQRDLLTTAVLSDVRARLEESESQ